MAVTGGGGGAANGAGVQDWADARRGSNADTAIATADRRVSRAPSGPMETDARNLGNADAP